MCGIFGCLSTHVHDDVERRLSRVVESLSHRGPDSNGTWVDAGAGIAMAHTRLSIIDLSPRAAQPAHSRDGRFVLCYNGEVYNFDEIRRVIGAETGMTDLGGDSDTNVIVEALACWGLTRSIEKFVGMFAFAAWDRETGTLHLVRDRVGIKPLYWGFVQGVFVFASELKAVCSYFGGSLEIDRDALAQYTQYGYVPVPATIYRGIHKLAPGTMLTIRPGGEPHIAPYWRMDDAAARGIASRRNVTDTEALSGLADIAMDAVRSRMIADVPLGAFLSGGIDSPLVVAMMQECSTHPVRTFTIGFAEREFDEAAAAARIAAHLGTEHTEFRVSARDAQEVIRDLPFIYDEPFSDASQIPTLLVSRLTRREVTVALSGDGGDEMFAGYVRHALAHGLFKTTSRLGPGTAAALRALFTLLPATLWNRTLGRLAAMRDVGDRLFKFADLLGLDTPHVYDSLVRQWNARDAVVNAAPRTPGSGIAEMPSMVTDPVEQMQLLDAMHYLPDDVLTKVDRASMSASLEVRVPLLDHRLVEYAWRMPLHMKRRAGEGKWALRRLLSRHLPPELVDPRKRGFFMPVDAWLRGDLRAWADSYLTRDRLDAHGLFNTELVMQRWQEHLNGSRNRRQEIWNILMFQLWHERWA